MWVKICGNTTVEDAVKAAELGADAVGFVFAESKRRVTAAQAALITKELPENIERVGVFYSRDPAEIGAIAEQAGLTAVQLHGGLDEDLVHRLAERFAGQVSLIQTLHWVVNQDGAHGSAATLAAELARVHATGEVDRVLVDSKVGLVGGGTGVAFDWAAARTAFAAAPDGLRLMVAGGLKPNNVAEAVAELRPWGVDVCSGVELAPGRKDHAALAEFLANARRAQTP